MIIISEATRGKLVEAVHTPPSAFLDPNAPVVMTGNTGHPEVMVTLEEQAKAPARVVCADGTIVEIKPGKSKTFFQYKFDTRLHLLDCTCETCVDARAKKEEQAQ